MATAEQSIHEALNAFPFGAELVGAVRFGKGHINDTFVVHTQPPEDDCRRYILQRVSAAAFHHPEQLMANMVGVTTYLKKIIIANGGDPERETLTFLSTNQGEPYFTDSEGRAWRCTPFIEHTVCIQSAENPALYAASARAFGRFQKLLAGYPADTLYETIEKFHDTENRLALFQTALELDVMGRAKEVGPEVQFVLDHKDDCSVALNALREGTLPLRVTHNDTKINNVLIDRESNEGICIIDLDTVMPGLSINDFGDSIRFGANHSAEDEQDLSKVNFDLGLFETYAQGFLGEAGDILTPAEKDYMPWGAKLMTLECGIRFLTDYLDGDHYFATHRAGQNLDRCRTQFKLVADMERNWQDMKRVIEKYA